MDWGLVIFLLVGVIINFIFSDTYYFEKEWNNYYHPKAHLCVGIFLRIAMPYAYTIATLIGPNSRDVDFIPPLKKLSCFHNCRDYSSITFEDYDYDKDGNLMTEYNHENFGHRETYRVWTCRLCGKIQKDRLQ